MIKPLLRLTSAALAFCCTLSHAQPFPSTYQPLPSQPTLISNATILTGDGQRLNGASLLMRDGKIVWVGSG